ncbi:MAG: hypothetical protein GVY13_16880 [Alphaproteobacteria bacterium]|nr:hypothetical protein [Alphaproteobacteria bacterium]
MNAVSETTPCVLDKARAADIRLDPFPHLVVEDALPWDYYARLQATKPDFGMRANAAIQPANQRIPFFGQFLRDNPAVDPIWQEFIDRHTAPSFFKSALALFRPLFDEHHPHLSAWLAANPAPRFGLLHREGFDAVDVVTDCRAEFMTPVRGAPAAHRRGHVDTANRLYSGLFYMREPDDDTEPPGDLNLFSWAAGTPGRLDRHEIPDEELRIAVTVPYRANIFVLFPNSPYALHGAAERGAGGTLRSYVFITAEVETDLF